MNKTIMTFIVYALPVMGFAAAGNGATFKTLHQFSGGSDGANSSAELVIVGNTLFGTTVYGGGTKNGGTIFSIDLTTGVESVVHAFLGPLDGGNPVAGLLAWKGALYGTTEFGGGYGSGEAFKFDPGTATLTPLYTFGANDDAAFPESKLVEYKGKLYGTSANGGDDGDNGTIFALNPETGSEYVVISFGDGDNGAFPVGRLLEKDGLLYGMTNFDGGALFSIDPNQGSGSFTTVYSFDTGKLGYLGGPPLVGVIDDGRRLLGTTGYGGRVKENGHGTLFSINKSTARTHLLHVFHGGANDGAMPAAELLLENGVVYGTTAAGGRYNKGTVFQIVLATKAETILHDFTGGDDGAAPAAPLIYDNGSLYGTTYESTSGGQRKRKYYGTVFQITP